MSGIGAYMLITRLSIIICFTALLSVHAHAQQCQQVRINGGVSWFPFFYQGKYQEHGIIGDIVVEASKRLSIHPQIIAPTPWKRTLLMLKKGYIDIVAGAIKTKKRAREFQFSDSLITTQLRVIVRKDKQFLFKSIKDLKGREGLKIRGHSLGNTHDDYAQRNLIIKEVHDLSSILKMLVAHRADYGIYEIHGALHHIKHLNLDNQLTILEHALSEESIFIAFSKNSECSNKANKFFKVFNEMKRDGSIGQIQEHYRLITSASAGIGNE